MIEVLKQALKAFEVAITPLAKDRQEVLEAITSLRQAIAELESQEPVACPYCHNSTTLGAVYFDQNCVGCVKRMSHPPQRTWVGLTPTDMQKLSAEWWTPNENEVVLINWIEAKLKEKNT